MPGDKPEVGFAYGVEGDQALLSTIQALRAELKNLQSQQERTASSAETMARAWRSLVELAGALKLAEFARDVLDTRLRPLVIDALSRELALDVFDGENSCRSLRKIPICERKS